MTINIAINGFGRIGRLVFRHAIGNPNINIVAINDVVPADNLAYLLKYDSTHGTFPGDIQAIDQTIIVDGKTCLVLSEKDPEKLPWKELNVDYVIESTGLFTTLEGASKHLTAGAKRVIITAPAKGEIPTFVMGVNEKKYRSDQRYDRVQRLLHNQLPSPYHQSSTR